jgi:hypothetical protein
MKSLQCYITNVRYESTFVHSRIMYAYMNNTILLLLEYETTDTNFLSYGNATTRCSFNASNNHLRYATCYILPDKYIEYYHI